jgi:hypothetical protein
VVEESSPTLSPATPMIAVSEGLRFASSRDADFMQAAHPQRMIAGSSDASAVKPEPTTGVASARYAMNDPLSSRHRPVKLDHWALVACFVARR